MAAEVQWAWWAAAGAGTAAAALVLDAAAGDPPSRFHPTAWAGRLVAAAVPRLHAVAAGSRTAQRAAGAVLVAGMVALVAGLAWPLGLAVDAAIADVASAVSSSAGSGAAPAAQPYAVPIAAMSLALALAASAVLLKTTVSVRGMERHAAAVAERLEAGDAPGARACLAMIVKRDTSRLDGAHIASAAVESVSENAVDGVTGPLFYFGLFGLAGAFAHRTVSTLDSMVGYRTRMFRDLGWFAARCDTVLNYLPARLTALCMVAAAALAPRADWRAAYAAMRRDASAPDSANSGYTMAAMAGALGVVLEKEGCYALGLGNTGSASGGGRGAPVAAAANAGDPAAACAVSAMPPPPAGRPIPRLPGAADVRSSVSIMKAACAVFACAVAAPLVAALSWVWWHVLG